MTHMNSRNLHQFPTRTKKAFIRENNTSLENRKIKSSTANIRLRVGEYVHPDTQESHITQVIFFFIGRGEWIEKYINLPKMLSIQKHQKLVIWDHRGQGGSDGERSHVKSYDDFSRDAQESDPPLLKGPKILYNISFNGRLNSIKWLHERTLETTRNDPIKSPYAKFQISQYQNS